MILRSVIHSSTSETCTPFVYCFLRSLPQNIVTRVGGGGHPGSGQRLGQVRG